MENHGNSFQKVLMAVLVAAVLWFLMFSPWTAPKLNFWLAMTVSACVLMTMALPDVMRGGELSVRNVELGDVVREVLYGIAIAVALWGVFWVGDKVSGLMFDFARPQVESIYGMKADGEAWVIGLLLLCLIGPAEELFWRGYVQRNLTTRWGANAAFVATTLVYALVHVWSMNFMLVMAALTCGVCWGGLYRLCPKHLPAIVLSHALWDAAVFVWVPI